MKTQDLFSFNRSAARINESIEKTFGQRLNLESFDLQKLEDARNKLRTQIHDARSQSGFNENIENEALTKAQWMLDAINSEIAEREEFIADSVSAEVDEGGNDEVAAVLGRIADEEDFDQLYDLMGDEGPVGEYLQDQISDITSETGLDPKDDFQRIEGMIMDRIQQEFGGQNNDDEGGETDDNYAMTSAGFGSDEDYESIETEGGREMTGTARDKFISTMTPRMDKDALMQKVAKVVNSPEFNEDTILKIVDAGSSITHPVGRYIQKEFDELQYDLGSQYEDYPERVAEKLLSMLIDRTKQGVAEGPRDAYERDYDSSVSGMGRRERENDEGNTEPPNNFAVSINGKQWKVFKGRGQYADDSAERNHFRQLQDMVRRKSEATGKKWEVSITGAPATEKNENMNTNEAYINNAKDAIDILADIRQQSKLASRGESDPVRPNQLVNDLWDVMQWIESNMKQSAEMESAPPTAKGERMVKHIKKGYADDGKLTKKEKGIAYATAWKAHNKEKNESVTTGERMSNLREGEVQQASAIVTAKTMVDRVSRWIEELSGMENDTLLQLGDSIRDEMSQEQAKAFISTVAPAIQGALENLKAARETLATGVRTLTGEEQGAEMLGGEPAADMGDTEIGAVEPDAMNAGSEELDGEDEFAAAEPAAGMGDAGREQRESINRSNSLLKVLAG